MQQLEPTLVRQTALRARIGVARFDITPPVRIYSRMWGAAAHETAEGIHRPLTGTAIAFCDAAGANPLVLVTLDLGWWRTAEDEWTVRGHVLASLGLQSPQLLIALTHTHSGPSLSPKHSGHPGGNLIDPYLKKLRALIVAAVETAIETADVASLAWHSGRCQLAGNRIHFNHSTGQTVVGYNPAAAADDTLLVGRVTRPTGEIIATIANYACHPTTLGPSNRLISPDFIGAMREVVETQTGGAPCLFLQGASGELAPMQQYTHDVSVADRNGRAVGHAVLSALSAMLPHDIDYCFSEIIESGAKLGIWRYERSEPGQDLDATQVAVELLAKRLGPTALSVEVDGELGTRILDERRERSHQLQQLIHDRNVLSMPVWQWRLGNSYLIGVPAECFSDFQVKLRARHPEHPLAIVTNANGYFGYVPSLPYYGGDSYEVQVSLLEAGCLEKLTEAVDRTLPQASISSVNGLQRPHFPVQGAPITHRI